jgi:hypothetical protein
MIFFLMKLGLFKDFKYFSYSIAFDLVGQAFL